MFLVSLGFYSGVSLFVFLIVQVPAYSTQSCSSYQVDMRSPESSGSYMGKQQLAAQCLEHRCEVDAGSSQRRKHSTGTSMRSLWLGALCEFQQRLFEQQGPSYKTSTGQMCCVRHCQAGALTYNTCTNRQHGRWLLKTLVLCAHGECVSNILSSAVHHVPHALVLRVSVRMRRIWYRFSFLYIGLTSYEARI